MLTIVSLILILIFFISGVQPAPTPHLEWISGIQGFISAVALFFYAFWLYSRSKMRAKLKMYASPLIAKLEAPCRPFFIYILPLVALVSLIPPLLFDTGFWTDTRGVLAVHFFLIALFLDLFIFASRHGSEKITIGEEKELGDYKGNIDGAIEAVLKGIKSNSLTLADKGLQLIPSGFSDHVTGLEYRALYLFDNLELIGRKATEKDFLPFVQAVLGRVLRLSGHLLHQMPSLATAGVETAGRLIRSEIHQGHSEAAEKGLYTFVQGVRGLKHLPVGLGDYLIRNILEIEKGLEDLYKADKTRSVKSLLVPLAELKAAFQEPRFVENPETILGQRELDRVVDIYKSLDSVVSAQKAAPPQEQA